MGGAVWGGLMFVSATAQTPAFIEAARRDLAQAGRVHLPGFLDDEAAELLLADMAGLDYRIVTNAGGATQDIPAQAFAKLDQRQFLSQLYGEAKDEFRFLYDGVRVSEACLNGTMTNGPLVDFFATMNDSRGLELFRAITGDPRVMYLDMLASRYRGGHFLTAHNDEQDDGHRLYAFVFNFSRAWKADWGGLLAFYDADGHVAEAFTPRWGALNIFKVPQDHAVTMVAPFAGAARYSITGWMRAKRPGLSPDHPAVRG